MSTQYANDIPFSSSHAQQAFKLIELPPELLTLLESSTPPTLSITSSPATPTQPAYALLSVTGGKTYQMRQKNTSNPIMILRPSTTGPTEAEAGEEEEGGGEEGGFVSRRSICAVARIEDTIELIEREEGGDGEGKAKEGMKVNKWHEKFGRGREKR